MRYYNLYYYVIPAVAPACTTAVKPFPSIMRIRDRDDTFSKRLRPDRGGGPIVYTVSLQYIYIYIFKHKTGH